MHSVTYPLQDGGVLCTFNLIGLVIVSFCKCYIFNIILTINETIYGAFYESYSI